MADVGIIEGEKLLIQIGDGADPEVFAHPCLINTSRGITFTTNMTETEVADCTTPSNPAKIVRKAKSIDFSVTGSGKVDRTSVLEYIQWWTSAEPKNAKITQSTTALLGGWIGTGQLILKEFAVTGERGDYQEFTATFAPAGVFTWAAVV
jgi:hypothetical protein